MRCALSAGRYVIYGIIYPEKQYKKSRRVSPLPFPPDNTRYSVLMGNKWEREDPTSNTNTAKAQNTARADRRAAGPTGRCKLPRLMKTPTFGCVFSTKPRKQRKKNIKNTLSHLLRVLCRASTRGIPPRPLDVPPHSHALQLVVMVQCYIRMADNYRRVRAREPRCAGEDLSSSRADPKV